MERTGMRVVGRALVFEDRRFSLTRLACRDDRDNTLEWDAVERQGAEDVVVVFAVTADHHVLVVEQFRPPVRARVLELPAGICDVRGESVEAAARRELEEETGYTAERLIALPVAAEASGALTGRLCWFLATGVHPKRADGRTRREPHELDETERMLGLTCYRIPLRELGDMLVARAKDGVLVDPKIMAGAMWWRHFNGVIRAPEGGM